MGKQRLGRMSSSNLFSMGKKYVSFWRDDSKVQRKLQHDLSFLINRKPSPFVYRFESTAKRIPEKKKGKSANARQYKRAMLHNASNKRPNTKNTRQDLQGDLLRISNIPSLNESSMVAVFTAKLWGWTPLLPYKSTKGGRWYLRTKNAPWLPRSQGLKSSSISKGPEVENSWGEIHESYDIKHFQLL